MYLGNCVSKLLETMVFCAELQFDINFMKSRKNGLKLVPYLLGNSKFVPLMGIWLRDRVV